MEDLLYRNQDGRFVFYTTVFAAYSFGGKPAEPARYQTGSAPIRIEAEGSQPLTVQFFDEMPDVLITLNPANSEPSDEHRNVPRDSAEFSR
ncbi:hypothetical protein Q31b_54260 [Novipirellula aureliae]|uniref:Uncharacterized protein n=1 Tax=Novipirellula aureliae TaxID=2527966 RepID=A0A5C6DEZ2_9BACT|nr:hypothetical protein [Novipirellula aureliae]TWU35330.1 hypothetical protein Q31b_54260 [Novipirellula aureliae]